MSEDAALALLRLLSRDGTVSLARAAKRLSLGTSQLQRLLVALGDDPRFDGLDLVERIDEDGRARLRLTARGRALCASADALAADATGADLAGAGAAGAGARDARAVDATAHGHRGRDGTGA